MYDGVRDDKYGTVHVINGAAGNNEGLVVWKGVGGLIASANYKEHGFGSNCVSGDTLKCTHAVRDGCRV